MVTLVLVPVVYAIFVYDLKWIKWEKEKESPEVSGEVSHPVEVY